MDAKSCKFLGLLTDDKIEISQKMQEDEITVNHKITALETS